MKNISNNAVIVSLPENKMELIIYTVWVDENKFTCRYINPGKVNVW